MRRDAPVLTMTYMIWQDTESKNFQYGTMPTVLTTEEAKKVVRRRAATLHREGKINCCLFILDSTPFPGSSTYFLGGVGFNIDKQTFVDTFR